MKIARLIFKLHRMVYGYPCKSEVRLALELELFHNYGLTYSAAMLYICGEDLDEIADWLGISRKQVIDILNEKVGR